MAESTVTATRGVDVRTDGVTAEDRSVRRASVVAGSALFLMTVLAAFANFYVLDGLVVAGDAAQTASNVTASETLFRLGVASLFVVAVLDLVVAWSLYAVFEPVSRNLSMLAALLRSVFAGVFVVAISQLLGVLSLLGDPGSLAAFSPAQLQAQALLRIGSFYDVWDGALILVGLHLVAVGYLSYRSGYVPRVLGVLLVVAGVGYVVDSFGRVLSAGYSTEVAAVTFVGEVLLIGWLFLVGRRVQLRPDLPTE